MKAARSLKAQALQMLAQREHSRVELKRKLLGRAALAAADGAAPAEAEVDALIDWLEAKRYFSAERFVEARIHVRAARFGNLRIRQELAQHQVTLPAEAAQALAASEVERARAVWSKRFAAPAQDAAGRAKQARFLASRGFSADTIRRVLRHDPDG